MAETKEVTQLRTWIVMILVALVSGGGGSFLNNQFNPPRPDPFTGTNAERMEERITKRVMSIETQHQSLMNMTIAVIAEDAKMHTQITGLEKRCNKMEAKVDQMWRWTEPRYKGK